MARPRLFLQLFFAGALVAQLLAGATTSPDSLRTQVRTLPDSAVFKSDLPAIFDVIWFEAMLTAFSGTGSAASGLRHYTYSEYDYVYLNSTRTGYGLGPYNAIGTDNKRVWFQEFVDELRNTDLEKQDRDRKTLHDKIRRALEGASDPSAAAEARDLASGFEIRVSQREWTNGREALVLTVKPAANYRPTTDLGGLARRFDFRVWIDERSHNVIRLEGQLLAPVYLDLIFREGSTFLIERQSAQGNEWLPTRSEVAIPRFGRMGVRYSTFQRFTTDVFLKFGEPVPQP